MCLHMHPWKKKIWWYIHSYVRAHTLSCILVKWHLFSNPKVEHCLSLYVPARVLSPACAIIRKKQINAHKNKKTFTCVFSFLSSIASFALQFTGRQIGMFVQASKGTKVLTRMPICKMSFRQKQGFESRRQFNKNHMKATDKSRTRVWCCNFPFRIRVGKSRTKCSNHHHSVCPSQIPFTSVNNILLCRFRGFHWHFWQHFHGKISIIGILIDIPERAGKLDLIYEFTCGHVKK